jgi:hypothetical protein
VDPTPYQNPIIATRPSKIDQLKTVAASPATTVVAIITAIGGLLGVFQTYQEGRDTARVSYTTLAQAVEKNASEIAACRQDVVNAQVWMEDIAQRFERKTEVTDKAIAQVRPRIRPAPAAPVLEPPPKPPIAVVLPERAPLPPFEALE